MSNLREWRKSPGKSIEDNLTDLIRVLSGLPKHEVHLRSRILHDLRIGGDDAAELLNAFQREFDVDMTDFRFQDYFPSEVGIGTVELARFIGSKLGVAKRPPLSRFRSITVADLVLIAEAGRWTRFG